MKGFIVDLVGVPSNNRRVIFCRLPLAAPLWTFLVQRLTQLSPLGARRSRSSTKSALPNYSARRIGARTHNSASRFFAALFNQLGSRFAGHACSMGNLLSSAVRRPHHGQKEGDVSLKS